MDPKVNALVHNMQTVDEKPHTDFQKMMCNDCFVTGTIEGGEFRLDIGIECQNCHSVDTQVKANPLSESTLGYPAILHQSHQRDYDEGALDYVQIYEAWKNNDVDSNSSRGLDSHETIEKIYNLCRKQMNTTEAFQMLEKLAAAETSLEMCRVNNFIRSKDGHKYMPMGVHPSTLQNNLHAMEMWQREKSRFGFHAHGCLVYQEMLDSAKANNQLSTAMEPMATFIPEPVSPWTRQYPILLPMVQYPPGAQQPPPSYPPGLELVSPRGFTVNACFPDTKQPVYLRRT